MKRFSLLLILCSVFVLFTGCQNEPKEPEMSAEEEAIQEVSSENIEQIEVNLINQEGISVGVATLQEGETGVEILVEANHLLAGSHGFHIHEKGLCETPSFESAGGHFNPTNKNHGFDDPEGPHAGDMENLEVLEDGTVEQHFVNDRVTLEKGVTNSLFSKDGTTIMIHSDPDDYISQPAGDAGERIVCGVIGGGEK